MASDISFSTGGFYFIFLVFSYFLLMFHCIYMTWISIVCFSAVSDLILVFKVMCKPLENVVGIFNSNPMKPEMQYKSAAHP